MYICVQISAIPPKRFLEENFPCPKHVFVCSGAVPGPTKAQESRAADLVGAGARLGGRQYEEPGTGGLHVPGPYKKRMQ